MRRSAPNWQTVVPAVAALLGAALVAWLGISGGFGVSADSSNYLAAARSLAEGDGFRTVTGAPFVHWPPAIPSLLAAGHLVTGLSFLTVAVALNAIAHGVTVWLGLRLVVASVRSRLLTFLAAIGLVAGFPLLATARYVWSEPVFGALVMLWMHGHVRGGAGTPAAAAQGSIRRSRASNGRGGRWQIVAALVLAPLVRYASIVLYAAEMALRTAAGRPGERVRRATRAAGVLALCALPMILWLGRNLLQVGALTGERGASRSGIGTAVTELTETLVGWISFDLPTISLRTLLPGGLLLPLAVAVIWLAAILWKNRRLRLELLVVSRRYASVVVFSLVYLAFLVYARSTVGIDYLGFRLVSPLFAPLVILLVVGADRYLSRTEGLHSRLAILLGVAVFTLGSVTESPRLITRQEGVGYLSDDWEAIDWATIDRLSDGGKIWSNAPGAIFLWTGERTALLPRRRHYRSNEKTDDLKAWLAEVCGTSGPKHAIWFEEKRRSYLFERSELRHHVTLARRGVAGHPDVRIYGSTCPVALTERARALFPLTTP